MIHFNCPSLYRCTAAEFSGGTGGDIRSANAVFLKPVSLAASASLA
jgi:hypothetical protein